MDPILDGILSTYIVQGANWGVSRFLELFKRHSQPTQQQAQKNLEHFAEVFIRRIEHLESMQVVSMRLIEKAMERPDCYRLVENAAIEAMRIEDEAKQEILAMLIVERLRAADETTLALASRLACEAVPYLNQVHLAILGFLYTLTHLNYSPAFDPPLNALPVLQLEYLLEVFKPYESLELSELDIMHLDSVKCVGARQGILPHTLESLFQEKLHAQPQLRSKFCEYPLGVKIHNLFELRRLVSVTPTSAGSLIGMYVANKLAGRETDTSTWNG